MFWEGVCGKVKRKRGNNKDNGKNADYDHEHKCCGIAMRRLYPGVGGVERYVCEECGRKQIER